jgi:hypothetical protein
MELNNREGENVFCAVALSVAWLTRDGRGKAQRVKEETAGEGGIRELLI